MLDMCIFAVLSVVLCVRPTFADDFNDSTQGFRSTSNASPSAGSDQWRTIANGPANESNFNKQIPRDVTVRSSVGTNAISNKLAPIPLQRSTDQGGGKSSSDTADRRSDAGSLGSIVSALVFVVVLIAILLNLLKRFGGKATGSVPDDVFEILGHRSLTRQQSIHFVRCGTRVLILGESSNGLNTLAEVTDATEVECLTGMCRGDQKDAGAIAKFQQSLWNYVGTAKVRAGSANSRNTIPARPARQHSDQRPMANAENARG